MIEQDRVEAPPPPAAPVGRAGLSTGDRRLWLGVTLLLLVSLILGIVVFGGSGTGGGDELRSADGILVEVQDDRLRLQLSRSVDGHDELDLVVRPPDRAALDIQHLRTHASAGLPTRIYYERDGERYVARRAVDLPTLP